MQKNIRANVINPGFIKTSYYEKFKKIKIFIIGLLAEHPKEGGESL